MSVVYYPQTKRAVDTESGMAVEFDAFGLYARERDLSLRLIWKGESVELKATYDNDYARIKKEHPNLNPGELNQTVWDAGIRVVYVSSDKISDRPDFVSDVDGAILVLLVQRVVAEEMRDAKIVKVRFVVNPSLSLTGKWSVD
jgi:hypothetical protein